MCKHHLLGYCAILPECVSDLWNKKSVQSEVGVARHGVVIAQVAGWPTSGQGAPAANRFGMHLIRPDLTAKH